MQKIIPYLVLARRRLTLQVVCFGPAHFRLPVRLPRSPSDRHARTRARIAVQSVLELLAAGDSVEDVLMAFSSHSREQALACVDHAARRMGNQYSLERVA